jgi:hypothetical protein
MLVLWRGPKKSSKVFYLVQQRSCFDEISRVQALGEGAVDRHKQIACRLVATALEAESRLTRGRAQLEETRTLTARNLNRTIEIGGRGIDVATLGEHDHAADAVQLRLIEALVERLD